MKFLYHSQFEVIGKEKSTDMEKKQVLEYNMKEIKRE